ncbi:hypothetical protein [Nannocystis punicea]|uniref:DUF389 domain-containing protein n=1 Tax=Nannocystis punicea TaxID=2995304 RepID=A0ABY7H8G8_9BACT|nr:hypothetical protein [Nannocystis poenicansa]WAS95387.1 hypothetical protein O0S08_04440 [Nannocystis poenicansa]
MREIRLTLPRGSAEAVFDLARAAGIAEASVHEVRVLGRETTAEEMTLKSSAPKIRTFLRELLRSPLFDRRTVRFSAHEVLALVNEESARRVTVPAGVPLTDVHHDLWRYCHITASFVARTWVSAALLAYAMLKSDTLLAVGALIFTPFSPLVLSTALGVAGRRTELTRQALRVLAVAFVLTVSSAAITGALVGGPMLAEDFGGPTRNFVASALIGVMAALADSDEVGRRQLLGLAMAYPFVRLIVWLGLTLALGVPDDGERLHDLLLLAGNAVVMTAAAATTYRVIGHDGELAGLPR